jgi:hypothetical protein
MNDHDNAAVKAFEDSRLSWTVKDFMLPLCVSADAAPAPLDLAILTDKQASIFAPGHKVYLPASFCTNTAPFRKQELIPFFSNASRSQGCELVSKGWEEKVGRVRICCPRAKLYKDSREKVGFRRRYMI